MINSAIDLATLEATESQLDYLVGLIERHVSEFDTVPNGLSTGEASALIEYLKVCPRKARHTTEPGYYVMNGAFYVVVDRRSGPGVYAMVVRVKDGEAPRWKFAPGLVGKLNDTHRITRTELQAAYPGLSLPLYEV